MARGSKTPLEVKAQIAHKRLVEGKTGVQIAKEMNMPERTVHKINSTDIAEVCDHSAIIQRIIANDMETIENMSEVAKRFSKEVKDKEKLDKNEVQTSNEITKEAFKRSQIYQGKPADKAEIAINEIQIL